jgi:DNA-binding NtrC family response regulator
MIFRMIKSPSSILIVNSEPDLADLFAEMISMGVEKYIINVAYTGKECLQTLEMYIPDLILIDVELKDVGGWDLIEKIKKLKPDTLIIVITAKQPQIEDFPHLSMISDYIMRPVTLDGLQMAVKDALEVPRILDKCINDMKDVKDDEEILGHIMENIKIINQSILDRKLFVLLKQIYPADNDPTIEQYLDNLRKKLDAAHNEIESFLGQECLLTNINI